MRNKDVVLVTGATGFLGQRLVRELLRQNYGVRVLIRKESQREQFEGLDVGFAVGELGNAESLSHAMKGIAYVQHLAALASDWAPDPRRFYEVNFAGTLRLLEAAVRNGVRRTVVASTAATIGPPDPDNVYPVTETHVRKVDLFTEYASSKLMMEERIQHLVRSGQDIVITNPTRIFGPGDYSRKNGLILLMDHLLHRPVAIVPGQRDVVGNYVDVGDVARGHVLAMEKGRSGEKYLLGGHDLGLGEYLEAVERVLEQKGRRIRIPFGVLRIFAGLGKLWMAAGRQPMVTSEYLEKLQYPWPVSSQKAIEELNYCISPLEQTIREMHDYLQILRKK